MNMTSKFVISPEARHRRVGEETVILHLGSGTYFGLNPVGARVWQLIETGKSLGEMCDAMTDEFDVSREVLERDVLALLRDLADNNLLSVA